MVVVVVAAAAAAAAVVALDSASIYPRVSSCVQETLPDLETRKPKPRKASIKHTGCWADEWSG